MTAHLGRLTEEVLKPQNGLGTIPSQPYVEAGIKSREDCGQNPVNLTMIGLKSARPGRRLRHFGADRGGRTTV